MKQLNVVGIAGALLTLAGGTFKLMHWPGANIMLILGLTLTFVFTFTWMTSGSKSVTNSKEKNALLVASLLIMFAIVAAMFKIQHWPGGGIMVKAHLALVIVAFVPMFLMYLSSEQDQTKKDSRTAFFVLYVVISGVFLAIGGNSKFILNSFASPDKAMVSMSGMMASNNAKLYEVALADSASKEKAEKIKQLSDEMTSHIKKLKLHLMRETDSDLMGMPDDSVTMEKLMLKDNYDVPTHILIGNEPLKPKEGEFSGSELKEKINSYKEGMTAVFDGASQFGIGLNTDDVKYKDMTETWEINTFYHVPICAVVISLDQLECEVRCAESNALNALLRK